MPSAAELTQLPENQCNNCMNAKKNKAVVANGKHLTWNQPVTQVSVATEMGWFWFLHSTFLLKHSKRTCLIHPSTHRFYLEFTDEPIRV